MRPSTDLLGALLNTLNCFCEYQRNARTSKLYGRGAGGFLLASIFM